MSTRDTGGAETTRSWMIAVVTSSVLYCIVSSALCIVGKLILHFSFSESDIFPARAVC